MIIATAGHVDHGKTTLVRTLTGVDTDRLEAEKQRGLSIELGFAYWNAPSGNRIGFIDVPGHARFLPTMVSGIGGIDAALLVIAADDGVMPQTLEHLAVLDFLGIRQGIVAISKCDPAGTERAAQVEKDVIDLLSESPLVGTPIIRIDSLSGFGIDTLSAALSDLKPFNRDTAAPARLSIDRSFVLKGIGLVATGTLLTGKLAIGDRLTLSPGGNELRIKGLHAQDQKVSHASAGQRCAVNLTGSDVSAGSVKRGHWLVGNDGQTCTTRFDADVIFSTTASRPKRRDLSVYLHIGAAKTSARLVLLEDKPEAPGGPVLAQLITDHPVDTVFNDRFVLRNHAGTETITGGRVITPVGAARGRAKPERLNQLRILNNENTDAVLDQLLDTPPYSLDLSRFVTDRNINPLKIAALAEASKATIKSDSGITRAINTDYWEKWSAELPAMLQSAHDKFPHQAGVTAKELLGSFGGDRPTQPVLEVLLDHLQHAGIVTRRGAVYALAGFSPTLPSEDEDTWESAKAVLLNAGAQAPTVHEIAKELGLPPEDLGGVLNRAAAVSFVHHISKNRFLLPETGRFLEAIAVELSQGHPDGFEVTVFRDRAGIGRNLAIDVLEYFDRQGITSRTGNRRVLRQPNRN